ncbi:MAG: hypothetical protein IPJ34_04525 [Myxococcales bacterium]|nr:hypothetical protein [Myxococcales bacterium]
MGPARALPRLRLGLLGLLGLFGCASTSHPLAMNSTSEVSSSVISSRGSGGDLDAIRLKPEVCKELNVDPEHKLLDEKALVAFLEAQGLKIKTERARNDLVYLDVAGAGSKEPVRLRVAILKNPEAAGAELHTALLQHGPGSWGVHRANLAVLAPIAESTEHALAFAIKTKLACWGVLTLAGRDDTFVIPGGYFEM